MIATVPRTPRRYSHPMDFLRDFWHTISTPEGLKALIAWGGIFAYLWRLNSKVAQIEKRLDKGSR